MNVTINECYELDSDYQNQFLGIEVFPEPNYKKLKVAERSVNKVHYKDVYILEPSHYYYVTFNEKLSSLNGISALKINKKFYLNGLIFSLDYDKDRIFIFNASQNIIYIQKGTKIGEVINHG